LPAPATVERRGLSAWLLPSVTALLGFGAVCAVCWPGFMSPDSVEQLIQARNHTFSDDHPPLMAMIWTITDHLVPGPAGMLLLSNALYWGGLCVCFRYWPLRRRVRGIVFVIVAAFPPLLVNLGVVWKDILMQGALAALLATYLRYRRSHGVAPLVLAILFSVIAIGARHNGAPAAWPILALLVAAHPGWSAALPRWKRGIAALAIAFGIVIVLQQGVTRTLLPFVRQTRFWQTAPLFDLAGMSARSGELLFDPKLEVLRRGTTLDVIRKNYNPRHPGSLFYAHHHRPPIIGHTDDPAQLAAIARNWWHAVLNHPRTYFASRRQVYGNLLGLSPVPPAYMVYAAIEPNPYGYELPPSRLRDRVVAAFEALATTPLFRVWIYVLGCLLLLVGSAAAFCFGGGALALALSLSGILYHVTYAVLAESDDYRYSLWTILCTLLALCALPSSLPKRWLTRAARRREARAPG
jgi:hypothetical protein